jgi:hypothetical protein
MWQSLRSKNDLAKEIDVAIFQIKFSTLEEKYLPRWNQIYEGINLYPEYNGSVKRIYR